MVQREIKSVLDLFAELVTKISKKDFCVFAAMLTKTVALSKANRTELIERALYCTAADFAPEVTVTSSFEPDLKWRRVVPRERYKIDCATKGQCTVSSCIRAAKNFCMTERGNIKIFQNGFAIPLVEVQAVE